MAQKATIATAWMKVLPSLEGLQSALVKASRGAVIQPTVRPAKGTASVFTNLAGMLGPSFSNTFGRTSAPGFKGALGTILSSFQVPFANSGRDSAKSFLGGFSGFVGPQGISGYLKLGAAAAGVAVVGRQVSSVVRSITEMGDEWAGIIARIKNAVGNTGNWNKALRDSTKAANAIGVPMENLVEQSSRLVLLAPETIPDYSTALKFTSLLNKNMIATGASTEEAASATRQITQALGKGIVNGDELNSIMENAPEIARMLAKHLGVGVGQLKEMGKASKITGADLRDAVLENADHINKEFSAIPITAKRAITAVSNSFKLAMSQSTVNFSKELGTAIMSAVNDGHVDALAKSLSAVLDHAAGKVGAVVKNLITQLAPLAEQSLADINISPLIKQFDKLMDYLAHVDMGTIVNSFKLLGVVGGIAISGITGGLEKMLSRIPLVGRSLVTVKRALEGVTTAALAFGAESVSAFGGLLNKVGDYLVKSARIPDSIAKINKSVEQFRNNLEGMNFSEMPKSFQKALDSVASGSGDVNQHIKDMEDVIQHLSNKSLKQLPDGFDRAFNRLRSQLSDTDTSFAGFGDNVKYQVSRVSKIISTTFKSADRIRIGLSVDPTVDMTSLRQSIGRSVGLLTGIKIPDFLTEPLGAIVASGLNVFNRLNSGIRSVTGKMASAFDANVLKSKGVQTAQGFVTSFLAKLSPVIPAINERVGKMAAAIGQLPNRAKSGLSSFGAEFKNTLVDVMDIPPSVQQKFAKFGSFAGGIFSKVGSSAKGHMSNAFGVVGRSVQGVVGKFGGFGKAAESAIGKATAATLKFSGYTLKGLGKAVSGIGGFVGNAFSKIGSLASRLGLTAAAASALTGALGTLYKVDPSQMGVQIEKMTNQAVNSLNNFTKKVPAMATAIAQQAPQMISAFTNVLPQLVTAVGSTISTIATAITQNMPQLISAFQTGLQAVFDQFPVLLPKLVEAFVSLFTGLAQALPGLVGSLSDGFVATIDALVPVLRDQLPKFIQAVSELFVNIGEKLPDMANSISDALPNLFQAISDSLINNLPQVMNGIIKLVEGVIASFPQLLPTLIDGVITLLTGLIDNLPTFIDMLAQSLPTIIDELSQALITSLPNLINGVLKLIQALVDNLPTIIQVIIDNLPALITSIVNAIVDNLPLLIDGTVQLILGLAEALPQLITAIIDKLPELLTTIGGAIIDNFPKIVRAFADGFVTLAANLPRLIGVVLRAIPGIISSLGRAFIGLGKEIVSHIDDIPGKIIGVFKGAGSWLKDAGHKILTGLLDGLKSAWKGVTDFVGGIGGWITQHKGPPAYDKIMLVRNGELIMEGLNRGLQNGFGSVKDTVGAVNSELNGVGVKMEANMRMSNIPADTGNAYANSQRPIVQNFPAKIVRSDDDLYTAYPKMYRTAVNEAMGV